MLKLILFGTIVSMSSAMADVAITTEEATALVESSLKNTEVAYQRSYCVHDTMTCRTMYHLKDKVTGEASRVFYDTFYSSDRQVGSTCYFIPVPNDSNHFYMFTDDNFDGKIGITIVSPLLATVRVDSQNRTEYGNLHMPRVGTTKYALAKLVEGDDLTFVDGTMYDRADGSFAQPVHIDYFRVNP